MPYPVNATASAGGARNIKVNWTKPLNIFGVLKDYEVDHYFNKVGKTVYLLTTC